MLVDILQITIGNAGGIGGWDDHVGKRRFMLMSSVVSSYRPWIIVGCAAVVVAAIIAVLRIRKKKGTQTENF